MPIIACSPRSAAHVLYIMPGFANYKALLTKLGKHKTGKACLYIKKLSDIDPRILETLVRLSVAQMRAKYSGEMEAAQATSKAAKG